MPTSKDNLSKLIIKMVKDLEDTQWKYHGFACVRTMRNILIGKEDAAIAPYFAGKEYHGIIKETYLSLSDLSSYLDMLVRMNVLSYCFTSKGKKMYCTTDYLDGVI